MNIACYHGNNNIERFLAAFSPEDAIAWVKKAGIDTIERFGYLYPSSENASDMADKLIAYAEKIGVVIKYEAGDIDIEKLIAEYDSVIIATGSFAYNKTGSDGSGYKFLEKIGVHYSRVLPALCAINCDNEKFFSECHGNRILGKVSVIVDDTIAASDTGEIQITETGFSGIPVFNISRFASRALDERKQVRLSIDTDISKDTLPEIISGHESSLDIRETFEVKSVARFNKSQVCTGGVSLDDLDENLQLKAVKGVYCVGELCDVDGICGGYNLHWAWCSGIAAGKAAAL